MPKATLYIHSDNLYYTSKCTVGCPLKRHLPHHHCANSNKIVVHPGPQKKTHQLVHELWILSNHVHLQISHVVILSVLAYWLSR